MNSFHPILPLLPIVIAAGMGLLTMTLTVLVTERDTIPAISLAGVGAIAIFTLLAWYTGGTGMHAAYFSGRYLVDGFALFFYLIFALCAAVCILTSWPYLERDEIDHGEYYALIFFSLVGMMALASASDLITLFLGLEIMSIAVYVLVGFRRGSLASNEAAFKYFILGAFSAGLLLYGVALAYGVAGTTLLAGVASAAAHGAPSLLTVAMMFLLVGLAFKVGAVPFHMWVPDVYEGAPSPITGFMATAVKAAGFAAFLRLFWVAFMALKAEWAPVLWVLAIVTMFAGNVLALVQRNIKRMLAYSSIAHTGYLLVALVAIAPGAAGQSAAGAILYYLVAYSLTTLGAFAVVSYLGRHGERLVDLDDYAGSAARHPWLAAGMAVCMASLIGFPPTAGFFGKYYLFEAAIRNGWGVLAIVGIVNSILSIYYYLRVVVVMYMGEPRATSEAIAPTSHEVRRREWGATGLALGCTAFAVVWVGVGPGPFLWLVPGVNTVLGWAHTSILALL